MASLSGGPIPGGDSDSDGLPDLEGIPGEDGASGGHSHGGVPCSGHHAPAAAAAEESEEDVTTEEEESEEDEAEEVDDDVVEGDTEPFPPLPAEAKDDCDMEKVGEKKMAASDAKGSGDFAKAVELYSEAIEMGHMSALTLANRADCLCRVAPPRPNAAIRDCSKALESNPVCERWRIASGRGRDR